MSSIEASLARRGMSSAGCMADAFENATVRHRPERRRPPLRCTARSVVRMVPVLGSEGSYTCRSVPVSLARVPSIDGAA